MTSYKQYKETFPNVYKDRAADYFTAATEIQKVPKWQQPIDEDMKS